MTKISKYSLITICFFALVSCKQANEKPLEMCMLEPFIFVGKHQPSVMILGVFHFGANLDMRQSTSVFDIFSERRQEELDDLLNLLKKYRPTKIMVEVDRISADSIINVRYQEYLSGELDISNRPAELYQIGFRLAKMMQHDRIYCVDAMPSGFCTDIDLATIAELTPYSEIQRSLSTESQFERLSRYDTEPYYLWIDSMKNEVTLVEFLRILNNPKYSEKSTGTYLTNWTLTGAGSNHFGADHWANLIRRDIRIFSNVYDIVDFDNEERLLLIIGATHVWALKQFFMVSPDFNNVEANDFLK